MTVDRLVEREARDAPCRTHEIPLGAPVAVADLPRVEGVPERGLRRARRAATGTPRTTCSPSRASAPSSPSRSSPTCPTCSPRSSTRRAASRRARSATSCCGARGWACWRAASSPPAGDAARARRGRARRPSWAGTSAARAAQLRGLGRRGDCRRRRRQRVTSRPARLERSLDAPPAALVLAVLLAVRVAPRPRGAAFFPGDHVDGPERRHPRARRHRPRARRHRRAGLRRARRRRRPRLRRALRGRRLPGRPSASTPALPGPSSQPVVGASDGGRLAVVFVNGGDRLRRRAPPTGAGCSAPVPLGLGLGPVRRPVDQRHRVRELHLGRRRARRAPGPPHERLERRSRSRPTSIRRATRASATGRSRVAISADGIGVVTWGEAGHVFARKMFDDGALQRAAGPHAGGRSTAASRRSPTCPTSTPRTTRATPGSSFARPSPTAARAMLARRQRGTAFDPPVAVDTGDEAVARSAHRPQRPRRRPRHDGGRASRPADGGAPRQRDAFGAGRRILAPSIGGPVVGAGDLREQQRGRRGRARAAPASRRTCACAPTTTASPEPGRHALAPGARAGRAGARLRRRRPTARAASSSPGCRAAPPIAGSSPATSTARRRRFVGYTTQRCCRGALPRLTWQPAFNLWGAAALRRARRRHARRPDDRHARCSSPTPLHGRDAHAGRCARPTCAARRRARARACCASTRCAPLLSVGYKRKEARRDAVRARSRPRRAAAAARRAWRGSSISWGDRTHGARGALGAARAHRYRGSGTLPADDHRARPGRQRDGQRAHGAHRVRSRPRAPSRPRRRGPHARARRPSVAHGDRQRLAGLVLGRRRLPRPRRPRRARARAARAGRGHHRRRRRVGDHAAPAGRRRRRRSSASCRSSRASCDELGAVVSVDTYKPAVARGGDRRRRGDRQRRQRAARPRARRRLRARPGAALVLMHTRAAPKQRLQDPGRYDDVVADVTAFLAERMELARGARRPRRADRARPGAGLRQDAGADDRACCAAWRSCTRSAGRCCWRSRARTSSAR